MRVVLPDTGIITLDQTTKTWNSGPIRLDGANRLSALIDFAQLAASATLTVTVDDVLPDGNISNLAAPVAYATVGVKRVDLGPGSTTVLQPSGIVQITATVSTGANMVAKFKARVSAA